jgi:uncharacterized protein YndB with AHSA1/START domain
VRVEKSIVIQRSVEEVFDFITDIDKLSLWFPVKKVQVLTEGPIRVGSSYVQTVDMMGQVFDVNTEVTSYERPNSFAIKGSSGPVPLASTFTLTPTNDGTRLTMVGEGEPDGAMKFAGPFLNGIVKQQVDAQLKALKRVLEK